MRHVGGPPGGTTPERGGEVVPETGKHVGADPDVAEVDIEAIGNPMQRQQFNRSLFRSSLLRVNFEQLAPSPDCQRIRAVNNTHKDQTRDSFRDRGNDHRVCCIIVCYQAEHLAEHGD